MKKVIVSLLLSLLCMQLLSCLSVDKRREMAHAKEKRLKQQKSQMKGGVRTSAIPYKPYTLEEVGVDSASANSAAKVSTGKVRFFSIMPVRLVRRPLARFIVIINIKLEIVNCRTNFDYRLCAMNCAKNDFSVDKRCIDCTKTENQKDQECVKQGKRDFCDKAAADDKYVFDENHNCCDYIFKDCYKVKNDKLLSGCCNLDKYKKEPQCNCQYILDNQKIFPEAKVRKCCADLEKETGVPDKRCNELCTSDDEKCCAKAFLQPLKFPTLYSECCAKQTAAKECNCDYKINNPNLFNKQTHESCCAQEKYQKLVECLDCDKNFEANDKCCQPFIANPMKSQEKTKACCALSIFKDHDSCKKCEGTQCCDQEQYKKTDLCICLEISKKKDIDLNNKEEKDCLCQVKPTDERCIDCQKTPGNRKCCENYLNQPLLDTKKYDFCCEKFPTDKNCKCETIVKTPSNFKDSAVLSCCKENSKLNPEVCCEQARLNLNDFSQKDQEECCQADIINKLGTTDDGRAQCCKKFPKTKGCEPAPDCSLGEAISQDCCALYAKTPSKFLTQAAECCEKGFIPKKQCCCKNVIKNANFFGGLSNKLVSDCCKDKAYVNEDVCNTCLNSIVPDEVKCCDQIIQKGLKDYNEFPKCCLQDAHKENALCKPDCSKNPTDPSCCAEYFKKPKENEDNYIKCCDNALFKNKQDECKCITILTNSANYPHSTVKACCKNLPENPTAEMLKLCNVCDCNVNPDDECCKPKCTEVFKNPYADLELFDKCCQTNKGAAECQCSSILEILKKTGADQSTVSKKMTDCCNEQNNFKTTKWSFLGCQNCPYNYGCCEEYFKDRTAYEAAHKSKNPTQFEAFVEHCCSKSKNPYENGCGQPKECKDSSDLRCCLNLNKDSPVDELMKSCCANADFPDKEKICPCSMRPAGLKDYPTCCESHFDANHCCKTEAEYSGSYKQKCCDKRFDVKHCCNNGDFASLLLEKKQNCCTNNYNPEQCCSVQGSFDRSKCCNMQNVFSEEECCKDGSNISLETFKGKCCSEKTKVYNIQKSEKECKTPPPPCPGHPNLFKPCPYDCKEGDTECECKKKYPNNPQEYFKCTCLNDKLFWSKKDCYCALYPSHKDCKCTFENVLVNPSLKKECCKKGERCDCMELYIKYRGPTKVDQVEEQDKAAYKTCCDKYFRCGFCYDPEPKPETCEETFAKADKNDKNYKKCCSYEFLKMEATKQINQQDPKVVKCCQDFKCFASQKLCQKKPDPCQASDITDRNSPKHAECCALAKYQGEEGCQKCYPEIYKDTSNTDYTECCTQNKEQCCTDQVYKDVSHPAYNICCDAHPDKCCTGNYKDLKDPFHKVCCQKKRDCCTQDIYFDVNHADHAFCCSLNKDKCTHIKPCDTKQAYLDTKNMLSVECCRDYFIAEYCQPPKDCLTTVLNDIKNRGSVKWASCCLHYKDQEVCKSKECDTVFKTGNVNDPDWKPCCEKNPTQCPNPPQCYPDTVFTDPTHKNHKQCCEAKPNKEGCKSTECTAEIYQNVNNALFQYCCEKNPDEPQCNKPIPCITECNEDNEVYEEFFNKEGYVTMKGRMKKRTHQQLLNHIQNAKANSSRHH